jgi:hypothetical protein
MTTVSRLAELAIERTITAVDPLGTPPSTPLNVTLEARNLGYLVQWSEVDGATGYNIIVSSTGDMSNPDRQIQVSGQSTLEYFVNVGNTAVTNYVSVQSVKGWAYSDYSEPQSVTTAESAANSNFPVNATFSTETTIATTTLTATGGTLFVIGSGSFRQNGGDRTLAFRLKEDGVTIRTIIGVCRDSSDRGYGYTIFDFSTPAAGSHTYTLTAENTSSADVCNAESIGLCAMEIPLLVMAEASTPPSVTTTPATEETVPTGSEGSYIT